MVDAQIIFDIQLSLARPYQMLLLCGLLWLPTPLGLQRVKLTNSTGNCKVSHTMLRGLLASGVGTLMCDSNARNCAIRA